MGSESINPLTSGAPLIVYVDYKSPYAYLAIEPTLALADELGIAIDWRPFTLDITSYLGSARLNTEGRVVDSQRTGGQWTKVKYAYHDVRRYGSLRGVTIRGAVKMWDSSLAGIGMLWAKDHSGEAMRAYSAIVFERFWKREFDLEDLNVIERALDEAGARIVGFRDWAHGAGREFYDRMQREAFDAGIFGVPTYVIDREICFGREHLSRIRWMLTGRVGTPPDIAYADASIAWARPREEIKRQLAVAIDFKSLPAYLAVAPTVALGDELGITLDWQPLVVTQSSARAAVASGDDRGSRHRRIRAAYLARDAARYAADRGLAIGKGDHGADSTLAALGLIWVKQQDAAHASAYVKRLFDAYWRDDVDIEDRRTIEALMKELGVSVAGFATFSEGGGRAELDRVQAQLRDRGVFEVPTYMANEDVFLGRQHLPLLRSLLSPRS